MSTLHPQADHCGCFENILVVGESQAQAASNGQLSREILDESLIWFLAASFWLRL
jgi:hypothetical protein